MRMGEREEVGDREGWRADFARGDGKRGGGVRP